jgi:hypothetical protein
MKFLKVLINALLCGLFFSGLLALLIYDLNINLNFSLLFLGQMTLFLSISYGVLITVFCIIVFFIFQFFLGRSIKPAWVSPSFLAVSFSFLCLIFLVIFSVNRSFFLTLFDAPTQARLSDQFKAVIILAVLGFLAVYVYYIYKKSFIVFVLYFLVFGVLTTIAVKQRSLYPVFEPRDVVANLEKRNIDKKITIIGLEGLSFDFLIPLINEQKLSNFQWLMEQGSWGQLETFSPTEPLVLNNSLNTGKYPSKHRQLSIYSFQLFNIEQEIEVFPRFILFRQLIQTGLLIARPNPRATYTKDIWTIFDENKTSSLKMDWPYFRDVTDPGPVVENEFNQLYQDLKFETNTLLDILRTAYFTDSAYESQFSEQRKESQPQMAYLMLSGLKRVETYFFNFSFPDLVGDIDQEEITKYGTVIERYYQYYDRIIGKYLSGLKENELLVVYSPHSVESLPLWKRIVEFMLGNSEVSAYYDFAPAGVVFFYGRDIARGKNIEGCKLIDITPTMLYYLGLHVGLDMDGVAQTQFFIDRFRAENMVPFLRTYDEITIRAPQ